MANQFTIEYLWTFNSKPRTLFAHPGDSLKPVENSLCCFVGEGALRIRHRTLQLAHQQGKRSIRPLTRKHGNHLQFWMHAQLDRCLPLPVSLFSSSHSYQNIINDKCPRCSWSRKRRPSNEQNRWRCFEIRLLFVLLRKKFFRNKIAFCPVKTNLKQLTTSFRKKRSKCINV